MTPLKLVSTSQDWDHWYWPMLSLQELIQAVPDKKAAPDEDNVDWNMIKEAITQASLFFLQAYFYIFQCSQHLLV